MKSVSRFEASLLRILHGFLRRVPADQVVPLVLNRAQRPRCLSRDAVSLVQDALAKGCVSLLAHGGGWRRERYLRDGRPKDGRLWERTSPAALGLAFSPWSLDFLIWVTAYRPSDPKPGWAPPERELTEGDRYLFFLAYGLLRGTDAAEGLRSRTTILRHALCRLAYPEDFTGAAANVEPDFAPWTTGPGACILEAMEMELAVRWVELERSKGLIPGWQELQAQGQAQERLLAAFFRAVESARRLDLTRFLLRALWQLLPENASPQVWVGGLLHAGPRMADRTETHQAALALLRQVDRFRTWQRTAQGVGFLDEEYGAAQLWKADWERWQGDHLHERAHAVLRQLDPLRANP